MNEKVQRIFMWIAVYYMAVATILLYITQSNEILAVWFFGFGMYFPYLIDYLVDTFASIIQKPKKSQIGKKKHIKQSGDYV